MRRFMLVLAALLAISAVAAPPPAHAILICLDTFCDTLDCGLDNGNNVSCLWDWTCAGATDGEVLGTLEPGGQVTVAGELNGIGLTESWEIDGPNGTVDIWVWDGIGATHLLVSDTFSLNCVAGAQKSKPSAHEASGR